jgi:hypothetical protein
MKISKSKLKQIIKEELTKLVEDDADTSWGAMAKASDYIKEPDVNPKTKATNQIVKKITDRFNKSELYEKVPEDLRQATADRIGKIFLDMISGKKGYYEEIVFDYFDDKNDIDEALVYEIDEWVHNFLTINDIISLSRGPKPYGL